MDYEQIIMQIIVNGGNARSASLKAVNAARAGDFEESDKLIKDAKAAFTKAHEIQTELIQDEVRGNPKEVTLLMVHAQDHLMNALTVHDLAVAMIEESKLRIELEKKIEER